MKSITIMFLLGLSFCSCNKGDQPPNSRPVDSPPAVINKAPVANAGPDRAGIRTTDSLELRGSGSDTDGTIVRYQWNITAYYSQRGQYVSFSHPEQVVKLVNLQEGTYWCKLTVTDNGGLTATDEMVFHIVAPGCPCYPYPCDAFGDPCDPWDY